MNIGKASEASGVSPKMIRHYESIGLIRKVLRTEAGYRVYREEDVHYLRFIRRARDLGFSIDRIRRLLSLWQDENRSNKDVREVAFTHVEELRTKIAELQEMADTLDHLAESCRARGERPHCPILGDLTSGRSRKTLWR